MILRFHLIAATAIFHLSTPSETLAHGNNSHSHDYDHNHDHDGHGHRQLRRPPGGDPAGQCKDGDPTFEVGDKTYACEAEFNAAGGQCKTPDRMPEEQAEDAQVFQSWLEKKAKAKGKGKGLLDDRRLGGCSGDW